MSGAGRAVHSSGLPRHSYRSTCSTTLQTSPVCSSLTWSGARRTRWRNFSQETDDDDCFLGDKVIPFGYFNYCSQCPAFLATGVRSTQPAVGLAARPPVQSLTGGAAVARAAAAGTAEVAPPPAQCAQRGAARAEARPAPGGSAGY